MLKTLDRTHASLAEAFASLAKNAQRQRYHYLAAVLTLMVIVAVSAALAAVLAAGKQLDYRRGLITQYVAEISLLLHGEVSFLRRTELTIQYYQQTGDVRSLPAGVEASIRQTGVARGDAGTDGSHFDLLVSQAVRDAWSASLSDKLWRLYEAGQSTLSTQRAFELNHRAMLIGLTDDYAVITPSVEGREGGRARPLQPSDVPLIRARLLQQLQEQTGRRVPARDQRVWVGPYVDTELGVPVMTALSAYYEGDTPTMLVTMSIPVDALVEHLSRRFPRGTLMLLTDDRRIVVSSRPVSVETGHMLQTNAAQMANDTYRYTLHGAILREPLLSGFGLVIAYLPWSGLAAILGWQFAAIACGALLLLVGIALTAHFWGLRLLRTAYDEATRALENEAINHVLVSATPIGLCIVRQRDYSILSGNALAAQWLQHEPSANTLPTHIVAAFRAALPAADEAQTVVFAAPLQPDEIDGAGAQVLQFTCAPARYAGEDVLFCAILDITSQHALEAQLRTAQRATEAAMRERSNFFASMSHEIRTPLNALLGNLELFVRTPGLEAHEQRVRTLGVAADALRRIVNDILDFSKIDAGEMKLVTESFRPIDDFENLALSYAPMAPGRPIRFYSHLSPTLIQTLRGDRTRIAQIVNNLLSNAFKFTSAGKIMLGAEVLIDTQGRRILSCRVCDSGIGMDPPMVSRIFHPFVQGEATTSSRYGGTGLGLSICASLCELMGGHISVESVKGVGSAFSISIPMAVPSDEERVAQPLPASRGSLLVLCQETVSGQLIGEWLGLCGWFCCSVTSARSAQEWLQTNRPEVLVVTGEYELDVIATLRAVRPVNAVWITRGGPDRPTWRSEGVLEVSEFSHTAIVAAADLAATGAQDGAGRVGALPVAPASTRETMKTVAPSAAPQPTLLGLVVLVAEDNPLNQSLIVEQLQTLGCEPILAGDGRQALAILEHTEVDVVLTDIHMPVMDGYELLVALRRDHPGLPVFAFSAVTDTQQTDEWDERGFTGYIPKPTSLGELEAALDVLGMNADEAVEPAVAREPAIASDAAPQVPLKPTPEFDAQTKARYVTMLKEHLETDLPKLLAIVESHNRLALRDWAHSAAGGFLIVGEPQFATQCRELQDLCRKQDPWSEQMASLALALHEGLRSHFGLDEASLR
ncbi:two-component system capsular synthesis sensor histidine kinase RcsC [Paraburkholderia sp. GAS33]|uniref:hybrid sensor histidine kinase/response regulator n=1 Tax=Paraburkholderia sp. GAS33 TaxID=3035130 RepID=UPI003D229DE7